MVSEILLTDISLAFEFHFLGLEWDSDWRYIRENFSNMSTGIFKAIEVSMDIMCISKDPLIVILELLHLLLQISFLGAFLRWVNWLSKRFQFFYE